MAGPTSFKFLAHVECGGLVCLWQSWTEGFGIIGRVSLTWAWQCIFLARAIGIWCAVRLYTLGIKLIKTPLPDTMHATPRPHLPAPSGTKCSANFSIFENLDLSIEYFLLHSCSFITLFCERSIYSYFNAAPNYHSVDLICHRTISITYWSLFQRYSVHRLNIMIVSIMQRT